MHQPLYDFTPDELQRMDDDRSERECYRMEEERAFDAEDAEEWQRRSEEQGTE